MDSRHICPKLCFCAADAEGIIGDVEILRVAVACRLEVSVSGLLRSGNAGKALPLAVNGDRYRRTVCGRLVDLSLRNGVIKIRHKLAHFRKRRSTFMLQNQSFFLAHGGRFRLDRFRRGRVMLRLVKAQGANLHIIGEVVFVSRIYRHGFLGVGGCLFRLRIPLHELCEALSALRTGDRVEKRWGAERNIKKPDALNNERLAVLQIYRIACGIRERFSLRDRSCFGNVCNCFLWHAPAVLLHILIRNMNEIAEIEIFQLVGNNLLQRAVLPGFQMLIIQIALQSIIHKVNVHLNGDLVIGDGGVSNANLRWVAKIRL